MNERSFIVKSDTGCRFYLSENQRLSFFDTTGLRNPIRTLPYLETPRQSKQRDDPVLVRRFRRVLGFRLPNCFHGVRNNRDRLRCRVEPSERIWRRLPDELEDRGNHAQKARGINRSLHRAPAFFFRACQDSV